jgi:hypothetical protein
VSHLIRDLDENCVTVLDQVVATTPHGTYTFEIADVRGGDGCVVLDLREISKPQ